jgi:hypothetical protein
MCEKCDPFWNKFKEAERNFQEAKNAYLIQCRMNCDDKKIDSAEPSSDNIPKQDKILYDNGFLESQNKPGLWFKKVDDTSNTTVFIDFRKGSMQTYGFMDNGTVDHELIHKITKEVCLQIRALSAKENGQTELNLQ